MEQKLIVFILAGMMSVPSFAQEVRKEDGKTVIILDVESSEHCEKVGCVIIPVPILEELVKDTAKLMCGKEV